MSTKTDLMHSDEMQGDGEEQTEAYVRYDEGAPEPATPQIAESTTKAAGFAGSESSVVRKGRAGIVAIVGRANVGKSSLFNAVLGRREAIVADEPGTTRDSVTAKVSFNDKDFWLIDTAGLKSASDEFELSIQDQIIQAADDADVIAVVVEANVPPTEEDRRVAKLALKSKKPVVLVVNKIDKNRKGVLSEWLRLGIKEVLATSAIHREGVHELLESISKLLPPARIREDDDTIHIAILGRPNVGKSSLFNTLGKKQQAIVANIAGTTRDINRLNMRYHDRQIELMDTAGIRRSGKIERGVEQFSVLRALSAIEQSDISLLLMDANELNVQLDQKIAGLIKEAGKGLILVVTKWDTIEKDSFTQIQLADQIAYHYAFVPWAPLIFTSSETGQNAIKIFDLLMEIDEARKQRFKTTELNRWLRQAVDEHPPAGLKNTQPKLNYMVQEDSIDLPSFKVFGSYTKFLHWSYKRYLERKFREKWPLVGTPLKFWFIEKH